MKVLVIGSEENIEEFKIKFGHLSDCQFETDYNFEAELKNFDVIFDFLIADSPEQFEIFNEYEGLNLFVSAPKISLAELAFYQAQIKCNLFGFNGLPSFLTRDILEVSCYNDQQKNVLEQICKSLNTDFEIVKDRVGMVSPRIIFMIINEAFYTLQEGTATIEAIDTGMKLGTNYPFGPFEWCTKIGIHNVYETLEAIYEDTKDERYKVCPLLKRQYLLS
ncbi:MAG: 3-hydroxyacyl-CoA dehydrogenase [Cytophagales bacterium CG12_big_fil_rev_8_21_14_0_65_40_12]|nr:MAG: 3-hydroxyacyl-CoA dehydrogenase [Cytophagales bacterium CG12_big_fil_rev_8_21_14_0_65_40_12]PIW03052.1 MAG: 3-hydroxyacyl-CoA dehydrogenase [Cytophagales bacterium CG17_big_fil_post_rev_8_21_14_2_50_40_13]